MLVPGQVHVHKIRKIPPSRNIEEVFAPSRDPFKNKGVRRHECTRFEELPLEDKVKRGFRKLIS